MSFYSYKNANSDTCPGVVNGNILSGLNQRVCVQVKNIYDSCMQQEQLDDERIVIENIVPVLPGNDCQGTSRPCACDCDGNRCHCECPPSSIPITHDEAVQNAENSFDPLPRPVGAWTFESCRSSTTAGRISNLSVERMTDRPQFARVRCTVDVPLDVLFLDQRCQEWMGQTVVKVDKDILLCIPDDSIIPFTLESLVSAICVSGSYIGNCAFDITVCVTVVLKVLAEVDILIPTYGFCQVPPCEEFAENVCDELFLCFSLYNPKTKKHRADYARCISSSLRPVGRILFLFPQRLQGALELLRELHAHQGGVLQDGQALVCNVVKGQHALENRRTVADGPVEHRGQQDQQHDKGFLRDAHKAHL